MFKLFYSTRTLDYLVLVVVSGLFSVALSAIPTSLSAHTTNSIMPHYSTSIQVIRSVPKKAIKGL